MMKTRRHLRRFARWVAIVLITMLCTLLLLLIIFPIRFVNVDRQGRTEFYDIASQGEPHSLSGFSELSRKEQIERYIEWRRQYLQKWIENQVREQRDYFITESVKSLGRGAYIVDLSSGKYLFVIFNNKIILKIKIG